MKKRITSASSRSLSLTGRTKAPLLSAPYANRYADLVDYEDYH